ncbi:MAG: alpha/beta hydrolase family esterase [Planctomycetota bacterium]
MRSLPFLVCLSVLPASRSTGQRSLKVGGQPRHYRLHVPESYDGTKRVALILVLHGRGSSSLYASAHYGFSALAEKQGFLVAYPDALGDPAEWQPADPAREKGMRDVRFLGALIDQLKKSYRIHPRRVYACGHSYGGIMSHSLAAHLSQKIAAIGVVAGSLGFRGGKKPRVPPKPRQAVSLIAFHARDDPKVPFASGGSRFVSAPESIAFWVTHNRCRKKPEAAELDGGSVIRKTYPDGWDGTEVVFYDMKTGGHAWPDSDDGPLDATALIWKFFREHPKDAPRPKVPASRRAPKKKG